MTTWRSIMRLACIRIMTTMLLTLLPGISTMACAAEPIGPLVGHVDEATAILWARIPSGLASTLTVWESDEDRARVVEAAPVEGNDFCVTWKIAGLTSGTRYHYRVSTPEGTLAEGADCFFETSPAAGESAKVSLAFGSCAREDAGSRAVWNRMAASEVDGVVLLGDTPYIDATDLETQRRRYREFSGVAAFQRLLRSRPFWDTWDDHDFGKNDADGTLRGKENSRQVFTEYRANATFGTGQDGIYTKFRYGPIEVFLLDARWWSWTGPSFADPSQKTLLGEAQWEWLKQSLRDSDAPFKVIACGMIWDDKKNKEKDDWHTYTHEREAVLSFLGEEKISGVVLVGGDIHVSRVLRYATTEQVGYPLYQFITSPVHDGVIPSLNVPHPDLIRDAVIPHTFMTLTADTTVSPGVLTAAFVDKDGKRLFEDVTVTLDELVAE